MPERVALEPKVMTNKIIFSSEEQKKIDDARARFNVWRESLGCANGSLIVYGTVTQQYYTKRNDPLWWLTDVVSGIDGKSLELPGPSYPEFPSRFRFYTESEPLPTSLISVSCS